MYNKLLSKYCFGLLIYILVCTHIQDKRYSMTVICNKYPQLQLLEILISDARWKEDMTNSQEMLCHFYFNILQYICHTYFIIFNILLRKDLVSIIKFVNKTLNDMDS